MKKCLPIIFAVLLAVSTLTGCASQKSLDQRNSSSDQNNAARQNNKATGNQTATPTNGASDPTVSSNASAAYEKLIAYKTEDYGQQSVADFNAMLASTADELTAFLAAEADVISVISPDDENYDFFTTTMTFSSNELYCEYMEEEFTFYANISKQSGLCDYLDEEGNTIYEFNCFVELQVDYSIESPELVTIAERDKILLTFKEEMQNYLNGLSKAEIVDGSLRTMLIDKSAKLANSLSTENMKLLHCAITGLEVIGYSY